MLNLGPINFALVLQKYMVNFHSYSMIYIHTYHIHSLYMKTITHTLVYIRMYSNFYCTCKQNPIRLPTGMSMYLLLGILLNNNQYSDWVLALEVEYHIIKGLDGEGWLSLDLWNLPIIVSKLDQMCNKMDAKLDAFVL